MVAAKLPVEASGVASDEQFFSDYQNLFESEVLCDLKLKMNDNEVLNVHKAVLAARSPVFLKMLTIDMQEAKSSCVDIPDFDSVTMEELLRFLYCNKVEDLATIAPDLIYAADKYQIAKLKEMCLEQIISGLTVDNVLDALVISEQVSGVQKLFNSCIIVINT